MSKKFILVITTALFILGGQIAFACDGDKKKDKEGGSETFTSALIQ